jgi:single-stranded DNA-binding protein
MPSGGAENIMNIQANSSREAINVTVDMTSNVTNMTIVMGALGSDPEFKHTPNTNTPVTEFSLAGKTSVTRTGKEEWVTVWYDVSIFSIPDSTNPKLRNRAEEVYDRLRKGDTIVLIGEAQDASQNVYFSEKAKEHRVRNKIVGRDYQFIRESSKQVDEQGNAVYTNSRGENYTPGTPRQRPGTAAPAAAPTAAPSMVPGSNAPAYFVQGDGGTLIPVYAAAPAAAPAATAPAADRARHAASVNDPLATRPRSMTTNTAATVVASDEEDVPF